MLQAHAQARAYSAAPNQQLGGGCGSFIQQHQQLRGTAGKSPVSKGECRPGSLLRKEELQSKEIIAFDPGNGVVARPACLGDGQATYEMEGGGQIPAAAADHVPPKYILTCSVRHITFIACRQGKRTNNASQGKRPATPTASAAGSPPPVVNASNITPHFNSANPEPSWLSHGSGYPSR